MSALSLSWEALLKLPACTWMFFFLGKKNIIIFTNFGIFWPNIFYLQLQLWSYTINWHTCEKADLYCAKSHIECHCWVVKNTFAELFVIIVVFPPQVLVMPYFRECWGFMRSSSSSSSCSRRGMVRGPHKDPPKLSMLALWRLIYYLCFWSSQHLPHHLHILISTCLHIITKLQ